MEYILMTNNIDFNDETEYPILNILKREKIKYDDFIQKI
jgi:hypothetical protein